MPKAGPARLDRYFGDAALPKGEVHLLQAAELQGFCWRGTRRGSERGAGPAARPFLQGGWAYFGCCHRPADHAGIAQKSLDHTHRGMPVPAQRGYCRGHSNARNTRAGIIPLWVRDEQ